MQTLWLQRQVIVSGFGAPKALWEGQLVSKWVSDVLSEKGEQRNIMGAQKRWTWSSEAWGRDRWYLPGIGALTAEFFLRKKVGVSHPGKWENCSLGRGNSLNKGKKSPIAWCTSRNSKHLTAVQDSIGVTFCNQYAFVTHSFVLYELSYLDTSSHIELLWLMFFLTGTDYSYYHAILEVAFQFLSRLQQNLLKFCLSLHSYSATIQAFQQVSSVLTRDSIL